VCRIARRVTPPQLLALGGLWLKIGQYIASRSDMVPEEIVSHLSKMLDTNPPRPYEQTLSTLIHAWGDDAETRLDSLQPEALSCGSIAQVADPRPHPHPASGGRPSP
jgi:aarF domain-containing kinase